MPPSTPRKSCLSSSSSSCSSPTDSTTSTAATPPTPYLGSTSYDSPFGKPPRRPKKSVKFKDPIREIRIISTTISVIRERADEREDEEPPRKSRKRKERQPSSPEIGTCPCNYPSCNINRSHRQYSPPLLPPPDAPLPRPRKKEKRQQSPSKQVKVDVHMTFNFEGNGFIPAYPTVPTLTTNTMSRQSNVPAQPLFAPANTGRWEYTPPPYLGASHSSDPVVAADRKLRRKASFESQKTGSSRSVSSSEDLSVAGLRALRGRSRGDLSDSSPSSSFDGIEDPCQVENSRWEREEHFFREQRKRDGMRRETEKRRARDRVAPSNRPDLGDGLYGGLYHVPTYDQDDKIYTSFSEQY